MKYTFILVLIATAFLPISAWADTPLTPEESGVYTYEFPMSWTNGQLAIASRYRIGSGEVSMITPGSWKLGILNEKSQLLAEYPFNPVALAVGGALTLVVPMENSGATAAFINPAGTTVLSVDLRWSRICNDDGVCGASAGETQSNCPTDCGYRTAVESRNAQSATITDQLPLGTRLGVLLMRLGFGAAGVMLLIGVARMLDSRRGA